jgi:hypothetical protein
VFRIKASAATDATGLPRGASRSLLPREPQRKVGCHGLVPWCLTLVATTGTAARVPMPRACPVEPHVRFYTRPVAAPVRMPRASPVVPHARCYRPLSPPFSDATGLPRGPSRSFLRCEACSPHDSRQRSTQPALSHLVAILPTRSPPWQDHGPGRKPHPGLSCGTSASIPATCQVIRLAPNVHAGKRKDVPPFRSRRFGACRRPNASGHFPPRLPASLITRPGAASVVQRQGGFVLPLPRIRRVILPREKRDLRNTEAHRQANMARRWASVCRFNSWHTRSHSRFNPSSRWGTPVFPV